MHFCTREKAKSFADQLSKQNLVKPESQPVLFIASAVSTSAPKKTKIITKEKYYNII